MKRIVVLSLFVVASLMVVSSASAQVTIVDLIADGGDPATAFKVGEVQITDNGGTITVDYINIVSPWVILETHVGVGVLRASDGKFIGGVRVNKGGNPKTGQLRNEDGDTITLPTGLDPGDKIIVAAQAHVQNPTDVVVPDDPLTPEDETEYREESAWADGDGFPGSNWATYVVIYTEPTPAPGSSSTTPTTWGAIKAK